VRRSRIRRQAIATGLALMSIVALAAGCGGSDEASPEPVTIEGGEYAYAMPDEIEGGVVAMRFVNVGKELHEYALSRIDGEHTIDELIRDLFANEGHVPYATDIGGVPLLSPGEEITLTRKLEPGNYGLLCFVPSPDGKPHLELGMKRTFTVVGESDAALPAADAVITATADGYVVPEIEAGTRTIELRNASGKEPSWYLASASPGVTEKDFEAWIEGGQKGPSPVTFYGAMQSFPDGQSIFVTLDLEKGKTYRLSDDEGGLPPVEFTPR
jgi:uncharacterized cupredoxin-like copper-binding protein